MLHAAQSHRKSITLLCCHSGSVVLRHEASHLIYDDIVHFCSVKAYLIWIQLHMTRYTGIRLVNRTCNRQTELYPLHARNQLCKICAIVCRACVPDVRPTYVHRGAFFCCFQRIFTCVPRQRIRALFIYGPSMAILCCAHFDPIEFPIRVAKSHIIRPFCPV